MDNHTDQLAALGGYNFNFRIGPISFELDKSDHQIDHVRWIEDNGTAYSNKRQTHINKNQLKLLHYQLPVW